MSLNQAPMRTLKAQEVLFYENEPGRDMAVVLKGKLAVEKGEGHSKTLIAELSSGSIVGEMALIDGQPRSATIRALETTTVSLINQSFFESMIQKLPLWLSSIFKLLSMRLRDADKRMEHVAVKNPERSLALVLHFLQARFEKKNSFSVFYPWFDIVDRYCVWTGMSRLELEEVCKKLCTRGLVEFGRGDDGSRLLVVNDSRVLSLFLEYQESVRQSIPYYPYSLDPITPKVFEFLHAHFPIPNSEKSRHYEEEKVMNLLHSHLPKSSVVHLERLAHFGCLSREEGVVTLFSDGFIRFKLALDWKLRFEEQIL
jgi:CRP/FNR family transcriptional regulator, cyclic AMP receptor protein